MTEQQLEGETISSMSPGLLVTFPASLFIVTVYVPGMTSPTESIK